MTCDNCGHYQPCPSGVDVETPVACKEYDNTVQGKFTKQDKIEIMDGKKRCKYKVKL